MRSYVGDLPGYLPVDVWLPCLVAQLLMNLWSCVWARLRPENLESSPLSALCQVFSSQDRSCRSHDPQKRIAIHMHSPWNFPALGSLVLLTTAHINVLRSCSFQSLLHTVKRLISERLKRRALPCPCFYALGHVSTCTTSSSAKMRDKDGDPRSLRLMFMLVPHLVGLDSGLRFSHLQMKWHCRSINTALWSSSI